MPGISDNQSDEQSQAAQVNIDEPEQKEMEIQTEENEDKPAAQITQTDKINKHLLNAFLDRINKGEINGFQQAALNETQETNEKEEIQE